MLTHKEYVSFRESLPIARVDGTLENRMKGSAAADNLHAKTGTLGAVNALSGYVTTKNGQTVIFSLMLTTI
jgi:D-alanyl-D-alanine carboxypeptidase